MRWWGAKPFRKASGGALDKLPHKVSRNWVLNLRHWEDQVGDLHSCYFFVSSSRGDPSFSSAKKEASAELAPWAKARKIHSVDRMAQWTMAFLILVGLTSCSLVTLPVKVVGKSATTTIKVTGKAFGAALDAVGSDDTPETEEEWLVSSQTWS